MRGNWVIALLCLAAFAQTLLYARYLEDESASYFAAGMFGDQLVYLERSQELLRGEWEGRGHFMPGYPALLAATHLLFGSASPAVVLVQGLVYAALVLVASRVAAAAFGPPAAPWSAALLALQPSLGYYAGQVLTEFLTGAVLFGVAVFLWRWSRHGRWLDLGLASLLSAMMVYMRSEYLALALVLAGVVLLVGRAGSIDRSSVLPAVAFALVVVSLVGAWGVRSAVTTGHFALYNESPTTNLVLMGTWYRIFDPDTWESLQAIEKSGLPNEEAIARAGAIGPRPELSQRYMSQVRGPYERPLRETLELAFGNISMYPREYLVNHFVKAPILIWAGRNPVRHADVASIPTHARWGFWALQFGIVLLALWQAARMLRDERARMLGAVVLASAVFLTAVHVVIAVDERFTVPALPLVQVFAGAALAGLLARKPLRQSREYPGALVGHS